MKLKFKVTAGVAADLSEAVCALTACFKSAVIFLVHAHERSDFPPHELELCYCSSCYIYSTTTHLDCTIDVNCHTG